MKRYSLLLFLLLAATFLKAQNIDVQHYQYWITLSDKTDKIEGKAWVFVNFKQPLDSFSIDLVQQKSNGKGMKVEKVQGYNVKGFTQRADKIVIRLSAPAPLDKAQDFTIEYSGIPADGLIISKNKHGDRTFFADNWPNRAHNWIPCNDRPDDKASFEFFVAVPRQYEVISNGVLVRDSVTSDWTQKANAEGKYVHWKSYTPLSTKVMVIGAAKFAVKEYENSPKGVPISAWVYPQDSTNGFYDYALAVDIVKFFSSYIAPFPYQKLANVQSTTIFGGMENASCIFYTEHSVTGTRKCEDLLAHEIAHQWFGDMASEKSFVHLWLSEGFATYLTDYYIEQKYGKDSANHRLRSERQQVISFASHSNQSVIDSTTNYMSLLNENSYQKGAWVLHMLRNAVGDADFQRILQIYYKTYKGSNADTPDFEAVVEKVTGKNWKWFFDQWLYRGGIPKLHMVFKGDKDEVKLMITQKGDIFQFPLEVGYEDVNGKIVVQTVQVTSKETDIKVKANLAKMPIKVVIDPNLKLLFKQD